MHFQYTLSKVSLPSHVRQLRRPTAREGHLTCPSLPVRGRKRKRRRDANLQKLASFRDISTNVYVTGNRPPPQFHGHTHTHTRARTRTRQRFDSDHPALAHPPPIVLSVFCLVVYSDNRTSNGSVGAAVHTYTYTYYCFLCARRLCSTDGGVTPARKAETAGSPHHLSFLLQC